MPKAAKPKLGPLPHQNRCLPSQRIVIVSLAFWINLCQLRVELFKPPLTSFIVAFLSLSSCHTGNCQNSHTLTDKPQEPHKCAGGDIVEIRLQQCRQAALCHSP